MRQVVYLSRASKGFSPPGLGKILDMARLNNRRYCVTGLLLFDARQFLQALEGEASDVRVILEKIRADSRHEDIMILRDREVTRREFGNWVMAANDGAIGSFSGRARAFLGDVSCPLVRAKFENFADYV